MWDLFRSFSLAGQIGIVVGLLGSLAGIAPVFVYEPLIGALVVAALAAVIVAAVWLFLGPEIRRRRLLKRGVPAEARILSVRETGMTVQGNYPLAEFRFEVHPRDGAPYETKARCLINRFEIPAYQPGATVPVLIDPEDRGKVVLA